MTDLREMTLTDLFRAKLDAMNCSKGQAVDSVNAELSRRDALLNKLLELVREYLSWDLSAPGKQHAVEKWKAECRKALDAYESAKS